MGSGFGRGFDSRQLHENGDQRDPERVRSGLYKSNFRLLPEIVFLCIFTKKKNRELGRTNNCEKK